MKILPCLFKNFFPGAKKSVTFFPVCCFKGTMNSKIQCFDFTLSLYDTVNVLSCTMFAA
jgi:hypothetical protein